MISLREHWEIPFSEDLLNELDAEKDSTEVWPPPLAHDKIFIVIVTEYLWVEIINHSFLHMPVKNTCSIRRRWQFQLDFTS